LFCDCQWTKTFNYYKRKFKIKAYKKITAVKGFEPKPNAWQYSRLPLIYWPHTFLKASWLFIKSQSSPTFWQTFLPYYQYDRFVCLKESVGVYLWSIINKTTQQIMNKFVCAEINQRFLLNFGALNPNQFLDFSQHVRFLR
jgi:hypothetical protein